MLVERRVPVVPNVPVAPVNVPVEQLDVAVSVEILAPIVLTVGVVAMPVSLVNFVLRVDAVLVALVNKRNATALVSTHKVTAKTAVDVVLDVPVVKPV